MTKEKKLYLTAGFLSIVSILLGFIAFSIIIVCTPLHTLLLKGNSTHEYKLYDYEDPIVPIIEDPNQVSLLLFYPFFDFCMILFFFILGELMSMNKDFLISASLILTLTFIFLSDIALIILFQSKSKSQISLCQK